MSDQDRSVSDLPRVLVTRDIPEAAWHRLTERAHAVRPRSPDPDHLLDAAADCVGIVCQLTDPISAEFIASLPALRVVSNIAVGYDNIDLSAATAAGVAVTNTPGVLTESTADFTWALMLAAARHVVAADRFVRDGHWGEWRIDLWCGVGFGGKVLGLLGAGRIGQAVARRARGFGMRCVYHSRTALLPEIEQDLALERVSREELFSCSDFLSIHCPLSDQTRHTVGVAELRAMKSSAIIINTSRGAVVDEAALAAALADGEIAGAGLDVFEREPEVEPALLSLDQVVLAPHLGSATHETRLAMATLAVNSAVAVLDGAPPGNVVNPEVFR